METIGSRIHTLRTQKKLSQKVLGEFLGVSGVTVLKWEKDENVPKHESLVALAVKLDTTIDYILYGTTEQKGNKLDQLIQKLQLLSKQGELTDERIGLIDGIVNSWKPLPSSEITAQKTG
ncbi:helix-turn-helix domain-containing protein [Acinetobacter corruptisaponis]|uniref:Helix-turn-helix domain-containing protein n=1 Tax=Acinetobacter corruptisaponis TaxID=3045147 RepID=A0ABY8S5G3_9GAMM|nr:helix-turn-helix domain-containing protein [Acinetobacter sp. KCTC 92772]WHP06869.1 helix-turn-helix domain-containing protein [Acinetobacter sp. KCTC 92772]WHP06947.1 helix-turn-helix domain-containing protein [Acinetobacter sp. KCTC 92772]